MSNAFNKKARGGGELNALIWSSLLVILSFGIVVYDLISSYNGWGKLITNNSDFHAVTGLSYIITFIPTVFQLYYWSNKAAGESIESDIYEYIFWALAIFDCSLDIYVWSRWGDWLSVGIWTFVVVLIFGFLSEWMLIESSSRLLPLIGIDINQIFKEKPRRPPQESKPQPNPGQQKGSKPPQGIPQGMGRPTSTPINLGITSKPAHPETMPPEIRQILGELEGGPH